MLVRASVLRRLARARHNTPDAILLIGSRETSSSHIAKVTWKSVTVVVTRSTAPMRRSCRLAGESVRRIRQDSRVLSDAWPRGNNTDSWTDVNSRTPPHQRNHQTAVWHSVSNRMVLFEAAELSCELDLDDTWAYDSEQDTRRELGLYSRTNTYKEPKKVGAVLAMPLLRKIL